MSVAGGRCHCGWPQLPLCWGVFRQDIEEATQCCNSHGCVVGGAAVWGDRQRSRCESWEGGAAGSHCSIVRTSQILSRPAWCPQISLAGLGTHLPTSVNVDC